MKEPIVFLFIIVNLYAVYGMVRIKREYWRLSEIISVLLLVLLLVCLTKVAIYDIRGIDVCAK